MVQINEIWDRREEIEPKFTAEEKPQIFKVLKLLPTTAACSRECGQPTCMVLAKLVAEGAKSPEDCPHIDQAKLEQLQQYLSRFEMETELARCITMDKKSVLFLCTGNACRSQMAEGWTRHLHGDAIEPYSAGVIKHGLDEQAVRVMAEAGVDISGQESKTVDELPAREFDAVITLCDQANESCPFFPGRVTRLHRGFDDPPVLAAVAPDDQSALEAYRQVRDEIREFVRTLPDILIEKSQDQSG